MFDLSDKTRSDSSCQVSSQIGDFRNAIEGKNYNEELKKLIEDGDSFEGKTYDEKLRELADTVPLIHIFKRYKIPCNQYNRTICCPFPFHKNGKERTASFTYFPETNSFHCWGCKKGGEWAHSSAFVSFIEGVSIEKAAARIVKVFENNLGDLEIEDNFSNNYDEQFSLMLDFSTSIREFLQLHPESEALIYIEETCKAYDDLLAKRKRVMDEVQLARIIEHCKNYIENYGK